MLDLMQRLNVRRRVDQTPRSPKNQLRPYEQSVYSQQGEDGILREIFLRVGPGDRYFVEFGVEDGAQCNTALLAGRYGWSGLYIEADDAHVVRLRDRWAKRPNITVDHSFITTDNIAAIFARNQVPRDFDLLSIDVDGNDYWLWKALGDYGPRVPVIEYNSAYPPPRCWIMAYNAGHTWDGTTHFGASLSALARLGSQRGYVLLATDSRGVNAFFLRRDLLQQSGLLAATPEESYHPPRYGMLGVRHSFRSGSFVEDDV
ncbi:MAG: hypothetical protein WBD57_14945 [Candidatus Cybelea sp.]